MPASRAHTHVRSSWRAMREGFRARRCLVPVRQSRVVRHPLRNAGAAVIQHHGDRTMNTRSNLPITAILKEAKQLAAVTSIICDELGGATIDSRETELIGLADDLAAGIYDHFSHNPSTRESVSAYGASGKLAALMTSIVHANARAALAVEDGDRDALVTQIGWLQNNAREVAEELADLVEQLCVKGTAA